MFYDDSTSVRLLYESNPHWVSRLRLGAGLLFCGFALASLRGIGDLVFHYAHPSPQSLPMIIYMDLAAPLIDVAVGLVAISVWFLASPEPASRPDTLGSGTGRICRALVGIFLVAAGFRNLIPWASTWANLELRVAAMVIEGAFVSFLLIHLTRLVNRLPSKSLVRLSTVCFAATILSYLIAIANALLAAPGLPSTRLLYFLERWSGIAWHFVDTVTMILTSVLAYGCRDAFRKSEMKARLASDSNALPAEPVRIAASSSGSSNS